MKEKNDTKESLEGFLKERKEEKEKFEALANKLNSGTATINELNYLFFFRNSFTAEMSITIISQAKKLISDVSDSSIPEWFIDMANGKWRLSILFYNIIDDFEAKAKEVLNENNEGREVMLTDKEMLEMDEGGLRDYLKQIGDTGDFSDSNIQEMRDHIIDNYPTNCDYLHSEAQDEDYSILHPDETIEEYESHEDRFKG